MSALTDAIRALLESHPDIAVSRFGHVAHAERYMAVNGAPIGLEPERVTLQNLWVRADCVNLQRLADIEHKVFHVANFHKSKPNHDLFGEPAFKDADLIRFKIGSSWQAVRVISEAAGMGHRK